MIITETNLEGCFILEPKIHIDRRGYFVETYNHKQFENELGLDINFVQDNESKSSKGVLRGLHYQRGKHAQAKLVRVIKGEILDVVVDIRKSSRTFGKHFSIILSEKNKKQLFIPRGFAHGFLVLKGETVFSYKCDNYYNKASESGIIFNDSQLNIDWVMPASEIVLSDKDKRLQSFETYINEN
ncbi:MAG: dTDP-4-dehydrorhamnose 3,5-epimerase [Winogradskyella sp.]|uniref:dTDP-4-dehydrorhamnose 3,5-epimerase n=1 Tax=Winogradskyella sp. TaxID=1883156 RepID=UPI0017FCE330|nr:dTDP-4-dehydrorhamnose 3,5-epimerase [Winogradskyella sp.]